MWQLSESQAEGKLTAAHSHLCTRFVGGHRCAMGKGDKAEEEKMKKTCQARELGHSD